ncbi:hypothetical protein [Alicyclobacillus ferrooxydans]|uniref:Uncharacterized protein n=1 Tax=Alicyclobacillus ferrooxydans TaxID=471514 RepID=A0A0P9EHL7_9BACL|nr:hypothetical protein [Alicyclobacillus ferrooxydans]KPV42144.1 hypothetical protein AN477_19030 [Alicyclobacillus ferrooxydans]
MDHFWPQLPLIVPGSEAGVGLWWFIAWWVFQIVVMVGLLVIVARWAVNMDRHMETARKQSANDHSQQPPVQG